MPTNLTLGVFPALAGTPPDSNYPQVDVRGGVPLLAFDASTAEYVDLLGVLPASYGGGNLAVTIHWAADSATTGNVVWSAAFERHTIGDPQLGDFDLNTASFNTPQTATAAAPDNAGKLVRTAITIAAAAADNPAAGESYRLRVKREAADVADTMAGDALLLLVDVEEA